MELLSVTGLISLCKLYWAPDIFLCPPSLCILNNWKSKQREVEAVLWGTLAGSEDQPAQQCLSSNFLSKLRGPALSSTQINGCALSQVDHAQTPAETTRRAPAAQALTSSPAGLPLAEAGWRGFPLVRPISRRAEALISLMDSKDWKWMLKTELQSWGGGGGGGGGCWPRAGCPASKDKREIKSLLSVIDKRFCCPRSSKVKQKLKSKLFHHRHWTNSGWAGDSELQFSIGGQTLLHWDRKGINPQILIFVLLLLGTTRHSTYCLAPFLYSIFITTN